VTGKVINYLVHINRIKPYYYQDELQEDPDTLEDNVLEQLADGLVVESIEEVVAGVPVKGRWSPKKWKGGKKNQA